MVEYLSGGRIQGSSVSGATDGIGSAADLTLTGTTSYATGLVGKCIHCDFSGSEGTGGTPAGNFFGQARTNTDDFNFIHTGGQAWTINFWIKPDSASLDRVSQLIGNMSYSGSSLSGFAFRCLDRSGNSEENKFTTVFENNGNIVYSAFNGANGNIPDDTNWHMITVRCNGTNTSGATAIDICIDGGTSNNDFTTPQGTCTRSANTCNDINASYGLLFGRNLYNAFSDYYTWDGSFDEVSIWNRELSDSECVALYNSGSGAVTTTAVTNLSKLIAYWNFNDNVTNQASPTDEKDSITNVPTNTRYEETDTRKIYRRAIPSSPQATKTFTFGSSQVPAGSNVSLTIADSGTKMYLASNSSSDSQAGYQYTLSTAYDVSTASYASKSFNSWGSADIRGMKVKNNGQYFYRMSDQTGNKTVRRFTASTAYDISTLGSGQSYTYDGVQTGGKDVELSDDGTKMYGLADNRTIYQYTLSTAWDVTSASSASKSFSCNSQDTAGRSFMITNSGTKLRFLGQANKKIYTYTLSTAWDISTASYDGAGSDISCSFTNNPYGLGGKDDGTWFAVAETDSPYEVQQFDKDPVWKERGTA